MTLGRMMRLLLGSVGLRFVGAGLGLLTQLVLAHSFAQSDVGVILLTMSMAAALSMIAALGYPLLALTQLPRFFELGVKRPVAAFHGTFLHDFTMAMLAIALIVGLSHASPLFSESTSLALLFGALSAAPSAALRYNSAVANGLRRFNMAFVPDFIFRPGLFLVYIAAAYGLGIPLSLVHVLAAFVISNAIVAAGQAWILRNDTVQLPDWFATRRSFTIVLRQRAVALAVVGAVTVMFADIVTLTSGWFLSHDNVAVVGLAIRLAAIAGFIIQATQQFVLPDLTAALTAGAHQQAHQLLMRLNLLTFVVMLVGLLLAIVLGGFVLSFFGEAYRAGHWLLVMFLLAQAIKAFGGMNQTLMSMGGHQLRSAGSCILGMVIFFAVWALLAAKAGIFAAGIAVIAAETAWAILLAVQTQRLTGRRADLAWLVFQGQGRET